MRIKKASPIGLALLVSVATRVGLQVWSRVRLGVTHHVEVVMVNVDNFDCFPIVKRVRYWISDRRSLVEVDRALVVSVVQLSRADQRIEPWRVNVIGDLLFDDANAVSLGFPK